MRRGATASILCAVLVGLALVAAACGGAGAGAGATVTVTVADPVTVTVAEQPVTDVETVEEVLEPPTTEEETPSEDATIAVVKDGFTQAAKNVSYGLVLKNRSVSDDALNVTVTTNVLDKSGTILESASNYINVIPAGETFYLGGEAYLAQGDEAASLENILDMGSSEPAQYPIPKVSNLRAARDEYGDWEVRGQVENNLDSPLSSIAAIWIVLFNETGNVVGGATTYLDADLPPGRSAAFTAYLFQYDFANGVATAKASVNNEISPS